MGEEGKSEGEWPAEGEWRVAEAVERGMWERQGSEAGSSPVVLLAGVGVREARGEGGGSEKEKRMRWEMVGQREVQELPVQEESQGGGALEGKGGKIKITVKFTY